jgi:hypothetical protein
VPGPPPNQRAWGPNPADNPCLSSRRPGPVHVNVPTPPSVWRPLHAFNMLRWCIPHPSPNCSAILLLSRLSIPAYQPHRSRHHPLSLVFLLECDIAMRCPPPKRIRTDRGPGHSTQSSRVPHVPVPPSAFIQHCRKRLITLVQQPHSRGRPSECRRSVPIPLPFSNIPPKLAHIYR